MKQLHNRVVQFTNWDSRKIAPVSPAASLVGLHPHAQLASHAFGDFRSCERLIQSAQGCLNSCVDDAVRHALAARPADLFFGPSGRSSHEDRQLLRRNQE